MEGLYTPLCGCFYVASTNNPYPLKEYLPQVEISSHTTILSITSRTVLRQTFLNPSKTDKREVQYMFPLYDGVTVVGFRCTVAGRVIVGSVKEKQQARKDYKKAVERGETAGLLEQFSSASDCFSSHVGNVPPCEEVFVEITYLGELKHDAETDGFRLTIPTTIAPRYGSVSRSTELEYFNRNASSTTYEGGIRILVDVTMEDGVAIHGIQSPSHYIAMTMGRTSSMPEDTFDNQHASVTLTMGTVQLDKDFILVVTCKGHDTPRALLETHPTIPNHRALLATLVPKFNLPSARPEIVFVADRSGSMGGKIPMLVSALKIFLKSLPVGVKFNICSFGSLNEFLWPKSQTYDESSLDIATKYVTSFSANLGGTEMLAAVRDTVKKRYKDLNLEVIIVTDGDIWLQQELFGFINEATSKSVRFFSLGIGVGASTSLVEGIARAGDGFAQFVGENEKMEKKVVRMLKGALSPHIKDYTMEVEYEKTDDDYEMVESATESLKGLEIILKSPPDTKLQSSGSRGGKRVISLFDPSIKLDDSTKDGAGEYDHLPSISTPKILQTPHNISPLYPFNRTSVYLLMSPESHQQTPKAIVLRATSEQGPLELVVPIQHVGVGKTLHQLAARKAVQELEEGRGWITGAKDTDGKLIKSKFEGRWDEIVKREAVRLGVQFQVANKWCSFIAVEENTNGSEEVLPDYEMAGKEELGHNSGITAFGQAQSPFQYNDLYTQANLLPYGSIGGGGVPQAAMAQSRAPKRVCMQAHTPNYGSTAIGQAFNPQSVATPPIRGPATFSFSPHPSLSSRITYNDHIPAAQYRTAVQQGGLMSSTPTFPMQQQQMQLQQQQQQQQQHSAAAWLAPAYTQQAQSIRLPRKAAPQGMGFMSSTPIFPMQQQQQLQREEQQQSAAAWPAPANTEQARSRRLPTGGFFGSNPSGTADSASSTTTSASTVNTTFVPPTNEGKMHELISLQTFDGSWKWTEKLFVLLGVDEEKVKGVLAGVDETVMATVLAVGFLEGKMPEEGGVWEMVVEKAKDWLSRNTSESKYVNTLTKVKQAVFGVV